MEPGPLGAVENRLSLDSCNGSLSLHWDPSRVFVFTYFDVCLLYFDVCVFVRMLARTFPD